MHMQSKSVDEVTRLRDLGAQAFSRPDRSDDLSRTAVTIQTVTVKRGETRKLDGRKCSPARDAYGMEFEVG